MGPGFTAALCGWVNAVARIWLGDASAVARVLRQTPGHRRAWVHRRLLREADRAAVHLALTGRAHPIWGNGSLMAAALRRRPGSEPTLDDADFCLCLAIVLQHLAGVPAVDLSHWQDTPMWYRDRAVKGSRDARTP